MCVRACVHVSVLYDGHVTCAQREEDGLEPEALRFGVWGLGFGLWGLGFGVWALGFGLWALGFGVTPWSLTANDCDRQGVERCC